MVTRPSAVGVTADRIPLPLKDSMTTRGNTESGCAKCHGGVTHATDLLSPSRQ